MKRNPQIPFTYNYSQPSEYHFSIDSIEMPWEVAEYIKRRASTSELFEECKSWNTLDLCAGCGVVGFELNFHVPQIRNIDFVEIQEVYKPHFETNKSKVLHYGNFNFLNLNYEELLKPKYYQRYNLILCNPPYFQKGQGKLSTSDFKNRCRFFLDSTFEKLFEVIQYCLKPEGSAFVLIRLLDDHGINTLRIVEKINRGFLQYEIVADVRGTLLLRMYSSTSCSS